MLKRQIIIVLVSFMLSEVVAEYEDRSILCDGIETICDLQKLPYYSNPQAECDQKAEEGTVLKAFPNPAKCNCGLTCIKYLNEGEACKLSNIFAFPTEMCGPMLACTSVGPESNANYTCQKYTNKECVQKVTEYEEEQAEGILGPAKARPNCKDEGDYAGVQCSPGTTCYCVNEEGTRLFGEAALSKSKNMTCECTLNWEDSKARNLDVGMRCVPNGNFDSLQCFGDVCYCFDQVSLELLQGPLHISMMDQMSCFDKNYHYRDYLNPCERELNSILNQVSEDVLVIDRMKPTCTPDGYYAAVQRRGDTVYCADIYGDPIEDYSALVVDSDQVNCNCARRRAVLKKAGEIGQLPKCTSNGNYNPKQTTGMLSYCVDDNGNQKGDDLVPVTDDSLRC